MLALTIFTTICIAAVLFLLRFLVALSSETKHASRQVQHISVGRLWTSSQGRDLPTRVALVYPSSPQTFGRVLRNPSSPRMTQQLPKSA
jgi:hypothetical protein